MNRAPHIESLTKVARWCLSQYKGILTETGKPKKPPTFWIVDCPNCGMALTSSNVVTYKSKNADRVKCLRHKPVPVGSKGTSYSYPASVICNKPVTIVKEITE